MWVILEWVLTGKPTAVGLATGAVAGLVSITPAAGFVTPMAGPLIGAIFLRQAMKFTRQPFP